MTLVAKPVRVRLEHYAGIWKVVDLDIDNDMVRVVRQGSYMWVPRSRCRRVP